MDLYQRQQFDFLLHTAVERYAERLEQRNQGAANALAKLRANPQGDGVWLDRFTDALFVDFLLDNIEGACFVLQSLPKSELPAQLSGSVEGMVITMAKRAFADVLRRKTEGALEQAAAFQVSDAAPM